MAKSAFRSVVCCVLAVLFPAQMMLAGDTATAMMYTNGAAWLNGSAAPKSAAVFNGDMLQTRLDSTANVQSSGSNVMVLADSLVKFDRSAVEIDHGAVRITTSRGMAARAGDVTVKPTGNTWTEFQVTDVDGSVLIAANKGDVTVQDDKGTTTTVSQGQQTTRDDTSNPEKKKKKRRRGAGAAAAAHGGIMSSSGVVYAGLGGITGVGIWLLLRNPQPMSPVCPTTPCQ
jgi:ferric-dicitrate binding protein FerR (iron transport regulator)